MKPCGKNRKRIVWLAVDALEAPAARDLRAHLEICEGCRRYFQEISNVTGTLNRTAITPDMEASESFHRRVAGALRDAASASAWLRAAARLRSFLNWRLALPALAAAVLSIAALAHFQRHATVLTPGPVPTPATQTATTESDLQPSIRNYEIAARRSLDQLDELLTEQAKRNPSFTPVYTASAFALANGPD